MMVFVMEMDVLCAVATEIYLIIFRNSIPITGKECCIYITKTKSLMLFTEIITVCSE
jgi:hypothetical protein